MKIPLTNSSLKAIIDDEDYPKVCSKNWYLNCGYVYTMMRIEGKLKQVAIHSVLLSLPKGKMCDHRNRNRLDNRKRNLRPATMSQNVQNRVVRSDKKCSRFKGTVFNKQTQRWGARIVRTWLGTFNSELAAAKAYNRAAKRMFGEFACLNEL